MTCSILDCKQPARTNGWCNKHHHRWRCHGDPNAVVHPYGVSAEERFWSKVLKQSDGCWVWSGGVTRQGYGKFSPRAGETWSAHKYAWMLTGNSVPDGLQLDHCCHEPNKCVGGPACVHRRRVNPSHLETTTPRINTLRGNSPAAKNAQKTHCPRGHELSGENLYIEPKGSRGCKRCRITAARAYKLRKKKEDDLVGI